MNAPTSSFSMLPEEGDPVISIFLPALRCSRSRSRPGVRIHFRGGNCGGWVRLWQTVVRSIFPNRDVPPPRELCRNRFQPNEPRRFGRRVPAPYCVDTHRPRWSRALGRQILSRSTNFAPGRSCPEFLPNSAFVTLTDSSKDSTVDRHPLTEW